MKHLIILLLTCFIFISCKEKSKPKQHFPYEHIDQVLTVDKAIKYYADGMEFDINGELEKAINSYNKAFEFEQSPIILNQLAGIEFTKKEYEKSITLYKKGRKIDSLYFPIYISEARSYGVMNRFSEAEQLLFKLKRLTESDYWKSYADYYLGVIYFNSHENCEKILEQVKKSKSIENDLDLKKQYLNFKQHVKKNCG